MEVKISVIIPVYNDAEYIRECLNSVCQQSLEEIEIICVDDASTDGTKLILNEFSEKDQRVRTIFHDKNLSACAARKNGVIASRGKYIMFVDGDDVLLSDACKIAYETIVQNKVDIVHFGTKIQNCVGVPEDRIKNNEKLVKPLLEKLEEDLVIACFKEKKFGFQLWNKIYNANIVKKAIVEIEDKYLPKAQDLYTFFLIANKAHSYIGIDAILYQYNFGLGITGGNVMSIDKFKVLCQEKDVSDCLFRYIEERPERYSYREIIVGIYEHFKSECINRWENNLKVEDQELGFTFLIEKFGYNSIIDYYASKKWFNNIKFGNIIKNINYIKAEKRNNPKKTIAAYYRCIENGGAQHVVAMLCNLWADLKNDKGEDLFNVILIVDEKKGDNEYYLSPKITRAYLPDRTIAIKNKFIERLNAWQDILDKYSIDIVISSMWVDPCTFWDVLAVKGHKSKPYFCVHAHSFTVLPYSFTGSQALRQNIVYEMCDGVITLSDVDETYVSSFNAKVKTILNPIAFNPYEINPHPIEENQILWLGRISAEKNPTHSILLLNEIVKVLPNVKLNIVGSGSAKIEEAIKSLISKFKLENNVVLHGFQLDVDKYYRQNKIFICTSSYEGFSLTLCEAMSHSLPVITYNMPWLTLIRDGRGIITVPQGDYKLMAQKVIDILKNKELLLEMRKGGRQQICDLHDHDIGNDWVEFLNSLQDSVSENSILKDNQKIIYKYIFEYTNLKASRINKTKQTPAKEIKYKHNGFIVRKIKGGIECYMEHGIKYTFKRVIEKIANKFKLSLKRF